MPSSTPTERYLHRLARRSFLSLWSYPSPFRDQGTGLRGEGAEVCDLLVIFGEHVLIFSDKDCAFPDLPDIDVAWRRWYKRAILKSAQQVWGAERWLRQHPDRVFTDRACSTALAIPLPDPANARFHRIVVAHDTTGLRRRLIGGTGSLLVDPDIVGDQHASGRSAGGHPFVIGQIDPARGYVHVLDDVSLGLVMRTLDTISDFVVYLSKKEAFITSGKLYGAFGEEDLLAYYLKNMNERDEHDFVLAPGAAKVFLEEGHWADFIRRPELQRKLSADRVSYLWDRIIEDISSHAIANTLEFSSDTELVTHERALRALAREPRVRRRMLAGALGEMVRRSVPPGEFAFRTVLPSFSDDPHYVFVVGAPPLNAVPNTAEWAAYRAKRRDVLEAYAVVAMHHYKESKRVVGIATENGFGLGRSQDLVHIDRADWDSDLEEEALRVQQETGWMQNLRIMTGVEDEYPDAPHPTLYRAPEGAQRKPGRNDPCPCGSNKKYKRCHGA